MQQFFLKEKFQSLSPIEENDKKAVEQIDLKVVSPSSQRYVPQARPQAPPYNFPLTPLLKVKNLFLIPREMWERSVGVSSACVRTEAREKKCVSCNCVLRVRAAGRGKNRARVRCRCPEFKKWPGDVFSIKKTLREKGCIGCGLPVSLLQKNGLLQYE